VSSRTRLVEALLVAAFLPLALGTLYVPHFDWEEVWTASPAIELLTGDAENRYYRALTVGRFSVPLFRGPYIGAVTAWAIFPFFAVLGVHLWVLRVGEIAAALAVAWAGSRAARGLAGPRAGALALFFLLFQANRFMYAKRGFYGDLWSQQLFVALAALFFARWLKERRRRDAFAWSVMLGLGVYAKLLLLWHALASAAVYALVSRLYFKRRDLKEAGAFAAGLLLSPYVWLNVLSGGHEAKMMLDRLSHAREIYGGLAAITGIRDFGFLEFCGMRLTSAWRALTFLAPQRPLPPLSLPLGALLAAPYAAVAVFLARAKPGDRARRWAVGAWAAIVLAEFAGLCVPVESAGPPGYDHAMVVLPLALIAAAVALDASIRRNWTLGAAAAGLFAGHLALSFGAALQPNRLRLGPEWIQLVDDLRARGVTRPTTVETLPALRWMLWMASDGSVRPRSRAVEQTAEPGWYIVPRDDASRRDFLAAARRRGLAHAEERPLRGGLDRPLALHRLVAAE
jgi:hypothetical protein